MATGERTLQILNERDFLKQHLAISELGKLRGQLNPHFMFNNLNSLKNLILSDKKDEAVHYLSDFSQLARAILEKTKNEFLTIAEEIQFLEYYLKLEQRRFGHLFSYRINIDEQIKTESYKLPSFLLQPIVENCIKHGFYKTTNSNAKIIIEFTQCDKQIEIRIEDNGIGRERSLKEKSNYSSHQSMGMSMTKDRIKLLKDLYNIEIKFSILDLDEGAGTIVSFTLPLID